MRKLTTYTLALLGCMLLFNSCKKEYESIQSIDDAKIQDYINANNLKGKMIPDPNGTGYYFQVTNPGAGVELKNSDSVFYSYSFKSLEGKVFNQTNDLMIPGTFLGYTDRFVIGNSSYLFTPIREVLTKLKRGGKASLIMPSNLAFGKNGLTGLGIASNEVIVLDLGIYPYSKKHEVDEFQINTFITKNNLTLTKDPSRAYYSIITPGTGTDAINLNSTIVANYKVRYLDGALLQEATNGTFSGILNTLYKGWQIVLPNRVTAGGKLRLVIPSDLAGGTEALDFDIEIVSVTN